MKSYVNILSPERAKGVTEKITFLTIKTKMCPIMTENFEFFLIFKIRNSPEGVTAKITFN